MFEQNFNYAVVPTKDEDYENHVRLRIFHCVGVLLKVCIYYLWAKKNHGYTKSLSAMVSQKAEAQAAVGIYTSTIKMDAAHLMNITVRSSVLKAGVPLDLAQSGAVNELEVLSAATTMQLKANNVGPDKVIDTAMTTFLGVCAGNWQANSLHVIPSVDDMIGGLASICLHMLNGAKKSQTDNYQAAIAGVEAALEASNWSIGEDCIQWAKDYGFDQ